MAVNLPIITEFNGAGIDKAIAEFKKLETTGQKAGFVMKKAFLPAVAALGALSAAAVPAINAASDLNETVSKTNVIFGDAAKQVLAFGDQTAKTMGISKQAALDASATFGIFGKAAGLTGAGLANFSTDFTKLAADLASFNNTTPEQAITAIGAALRGESEPIRQYGVLLNDATLKQKAMELGIYDGNGALTAQQKILAAQAAIYEQTTLAQGDFERTSGGLANQQRILAASIQDLQAKIGAALLPVVQAVIPYLTKFADWAAKNPKVFLAIAGTIGAIAAAIVAVNVAMALNPFSLIAAGIAVLVSGLVIAYNKFDWFRTGVNTMLNFMIGAFEKFANMLIGATNAIITALNFIPGVDIPEIPDIKLGRIGDGGSGGLTWLASENRGGMPTGTGIGSSIPSLTVPTGAGSAAGTASKAAKAVNPLAGMTSSQIAAGNAAADFFAAGLDNPRARQEITVNINGGFATSQEIAETTVNALRQYNQTQGPIPVAVA